MNLGDGRAGNETYPPYWYLPQSLAVRAFRSFYRCKQFFRLSCSQQGSFLGWTTLNCGQKRKPSCPAPQFPWGPTSFCRTMSNQAMGFVLPASQVGDVHHVLLCLCRYQKALCRSSLNSMKAVSCSLIRAKYPFFPLFLPVWNGNSLEKDFYCVASIT